MERAQKDRERKLAKKRWQSDSSDGLEDAMDYDDEEEEDGDVLDDELFRRIITHTERQRKHEYRLSYQQDVGSSFDPELEDIAEWERELKEDPEEPEFTPTSLEDLDDEELAAYADEYDLQLDDLPLDEVFSYSDLEDVDEAWDNTPRNPSHPQATIDHSADVDMQE